MSSGIRAFCVAAVALALSAAAPSVQAASDPAAATIESFDSALLGVMKQGPALGPKGREAKIAPAVDQTFDIPTMIRFAVGPAWSGMSDADHASLTDAFRKYMAASYAHNFDSFSGEKFDVDPKVDTRGPDKIVQSHLTPSDGDAVAINYRMRNTTGPWKVIDVYYGGAISQLTTRRSDFSATVASGGAPALVSHINALTAKLLQ